MNITEKDIILASASPRRHEILSMAGIAHRVLTSDADESSVTYEKGGIDRYVAALAELKNKAVRSHTDVRENSVVISADTVVYLPEADTVLGKPKGRAEAISMLEALSGKMHLVKTAVCIYDTESGREEAFVESTDVHFRTLSRNEIESYVDSCSPFDKAGAYGIQERAALFVTRIDGDYQNIVGLPVCRLYTTLINM